MLHSSSQGNIYAEVGQDYEVDSGFTEESSDLTSASYQYLTQQQRKPVKPRVYSLKKLSQPSNPLYSSDDSEQDQAKQFSAGRSTQKRHDRNSKKDAVDRYEEREGQCLVHKFYTVTRDGL